MPSLVLLPKHNTYISSRKPGKNFITSNYLYAGTEFQGSIHRILLEFDLGPLPEGIIVNSANLKIYADYMEKGKHGFFAPYIIITHWNEMQVTWDTQPQIDTSAAGNTIEVLSYGWYTWNITSVVQFWSQNKENNHGLLIKSLEDETIDLKRFYSLRTHAYNSHSPCLEVNYSAANIVTLYSRRTLSQLEKCYTDDECSFSLWQNTSIYKTYTFFVQNLGCNPISAHVQISPDKHVVFNEAAVFNIAPNTTETIVPQRYAFFTRLAFKSYFAESNNNLKIWFQAQV